MSELCINCGQEALTDFRDDTYCKPCARKNMNELKADLKGYELRLLAFLNLEFELSEFNSQLNSMEGEV